MPLVLATVQARVKTLGKDSQDQFSSQITDFIKDTVREITMTYDFKWKRKTTTITTGSGWSNLPSDFKAVKRMNDSSGQPVKFLEEEEYYDQAYQLQVNRQAYYRLQWDDSNKIWQIRFVNVASGTSLDLLYEWWTSDVTKIPDLLEQAVVDGATSRFFEFMEGDDLTVADRYRNNMVNNIMAAKKMMDSNISGEVPRVKTNAELELQDCNQVYNDQG